MTKFKNSLIWLLYMMPAALFCSYYPVILLGGNASMNFELSLPLIWLVIFDVVSFVVFVSIAIRERKKALAQKNLKQKQQRIKKWGVDFVGISDKRFFWFSLFPLYATFSIFWSPNTIRAILTAGIIWLLFFAVFSIIYIIPLVKIPKNFARKMLYAIFVPSVLICIWCIVQSILDLSGMSREQILMCMGCTYNRFGFPHPNGLAIEPQFMGNLLLAPALLSLYLLVFDKKDSKRQMAFGFSERERHLLMFCAILTSFTLFITLSRGAIYAFIVAILLLLVLALWRNRRQKEKNHWRHLIIIPTLALVMSLFTQGIWAEIGRTSETFSGGVAKVINQLSLGIIDLRAENSTDEPSDAESGIFDEDQFEVVKYEEKNLEQNELVEPIFDGYVAESTNVRLELNRVALKTWRQNGLTVLFGVGLGGAGMAMHENSPEIVTSSKEIVQNQPISLLLELGLIGIGLAIFSLALAFVFPEDKRQHPGREIIIILAIAYLLTLNFFAGLPNALHIYLIPALLYLLFNSKKCFVFAKIKMDMLK